MKVVLASGVAAWCVLGAAGLALAGEPGPRIALRWNSPDECPDDAQLLAAVESNLGETLAEAPQRALAVSVHVKRVGSGFEARLRFSGPDGVDERFLEHPDCAKLAEGSALLIALAIDPERVKARQQPAEPVTHPVAAEPELAVTPIVAFVPVLRPAPAPPHDEAQRPRPSAAPPPLGVRLGVFGLLGGGLLPSATPGLGIDFSLAGRHVELGVIGEYWLPRTDAIPGSSSADIQLSAAMLGLRACALPWRSEWRLRGCLGVGTADLWGTGQGVEHAQTRHALFPLLSAGLSLRYGERRLAPFVGGEGLLAMAQPPFGVTVDGKQVEVFRPSRWAGTAFLGLIYDL